MSSHNEGRFSEKPIIARLYHLTFQNDLLITQEEKDDTIPQQQTQVLRRSKGLEDTIMTHPDHDDMHARESSSPSLPGEIVRILGEAMGLIVVSILVRSVLAVIISMLAMPLMLIMITFWELALCSTSIILTAGVAGFRRPERAVARSIAAIPMVFGLDALYYSQTQKVFLMNWSEIDMRLAAGLILGVMLLIAFIVAIARRIKGNFREYLNGHLQEFRESLEDLGLLRRSTHAGESVPENQHEANTTL